jgi:NADH pyrophosphatase NudC (nudix superfamily)
MKHKVMAYVVRQSADGRQLLVFEQDRDAEAGVQVPAGTVEDGEPIEAALWRELMEESGLQVPQVALVGKLAGNQHRWLAQISEPLAPHPARS